MMRNKPFVTSLIGALAALMLEEETAPVAIKVKRINRNEFRGSDEPVSRPMSDFNREPDGVQINVDRPRVENYRSRHAFARDMANYRMLIDQAKKCEWPSRVPENIPAVVHANRRDWYDDNQPKSCPHFVDHGFNLEKPCGYSKEDLSDRLGNWVW